MQWWCHSIQHFRLWQVQYCRALHVEAIVVGRRYDRAIVFAAPRKPYVLHVAFRIEDRGLEACSSIQNSRRFGNSRVRTAGLADWRPWYVGLTNIPSGRLFALYSYIRPYLLKKIPISWGVSLSRVLFIFYLLFVCFFFLWLHLFWLLSLLTTLTSAHY